jgi:flagellar basal body-associated protein FliL
MSIALGLLFLLIGAREYRKGEKDRGITIIFLAVVMLAIPLSLYVFWWISGK